MEIQISAIQATTKIKYGIVYIMGMIRLWHTINDFHFFDIVKMLSEIQIRDRAIFLNKKLFIYFLKTCQFNTILFVDSKNIYARIDIILNEMSICTSFVFLFSLFYISKN